MKLTEHYPDPQRLYSEIICIILKIPRYVAPVIASLIPYANASHEVQINLQTKRTLAYEVGISLDSYTKAIRLAEKHGLLEVINSLRFQLKPYLTDCKNVALSFTDNGVTINIFDLFGQKSEPAVQAPPKADMSWLATERRVEDETESDNELPF